MPPTKVGVCDIEDSPKMSAMYAMTGSQRDGFDKFFRWEGFESLGAFAKFANTKPL